MNMYTVSQIAEIFDVSEETIRRWIRNDKLKAKRGLGRNGSLVALEDIVGFANEYPLYRDSLLSWLDKNDIKYDMYTYSSYHRPEKKRPGFLTLAGAATGVAAAATVPGMAAILPGMAAIGSVLGAGAYAASKTEGKSGIGIRLSNADSDEQEYAALEQEGAEEKGMSRDGETVDLTEESEQPPGEEQIKAQIKELNLTKIKLHQEYLSKKAELDNIMASIEWYKSQIEYLTLLLEKDD